MGRQTKRYGLQAGSGAPGTIMIWFFQAYWLAVADFWTVTPAPKGETGSTPCDVIDLAKYRRARALADPKPILKVIP